MCNRCKVRAISWPFKENGSFKPKIANSRLEQMTFAGHAPTCQSRDSRFGHARAATWTHVCHSHSERADGTGKTNLQPSTRRVYVWRFHLWILWSFDLDARSVGRFHSPQAYCRQTEGSQKSWMYYTVHLKSKQFKVQQETDFPAPSSHEMIPSITAAIERSAR
jgi:hypothetical protein